jgi:hypothetical protein
MMDIKILRRANLEKRGDLHVLKRIRQEGKDVKKSGCPVERICSAYAHGDAAELAHDVGLKQSSHRHAHMPNKYARQDALIKTSRKGEVFISTTVCF